MKDDRAVMKPAFGLIEMVEYGLFFISKYSKIINVVKSIIKLGFLVNFILVNNTFLGTNFFSETASLQKIKTL
tara:strand:+ start:46 stop:264 length:219 start_codon:yes stop_codon:yes gene_type:complete